MREILEYKDIKQADLARMTGILTSTLSEYFSGKFEPGQDNLYKLAEALNVNEPWLMGYDVPIDRIPDEMRKDVKDLNVRNIPVIGRINCGIPLLADENIRYFVAVGFRKHVDFALVAEGDSMSGAGIQKGDLIFFAQQPQVDNGQIAAVCIDGDATLKRFFLEKDKIILAPMNSAYQPMVYLRKEAKEIKVVGRAIYILRDLESPVEI